MNIDEFLKAEHPGGSVLNAYRDDIRTLRLRRYQWTQILKYLSLKGVHVGRSTLVEWYGRQIWVEKKEPPEKASELNNPAKADFSVTNPSSIDEFLSKAKASKALGRSVLDPHREAIFQMVDAGSSWTLLLEYLKTQGVEVSMSSLTRWHERRTNPPKLRGRPKADVASTTTPS